MDRPREPLPSRVEGLPELPADGPRRARSRARRRSACPTSRTTSTADLVDHLRLLAAWNAAINLTAIRDPLAAVRLHVLDSLTAAAVLRDRGDRRVRRPRQRRRVPGHPARGRIPARRALLVDSVAKKARFLGAAVAALGLAGRVEAFAGRAEELAADRRHRDRWPAVVARAVGSLAEVVEIGLPLVAPGGLLVAWKRGDVGPELDAARRTLATLGGGTATSSRPTRRSGLDGHVLVVDRPRSDRPRPAIRATRPAPPGRRRRAGRHRDARTGTATAAAATAGNSVGADRDPVRHPREPRRPGRGPRRDRQRRRGLAARRRRRLRAGAGRGRRTAARPRGERGPRQPRRGGDRRARDRPLQPRRAAGDRVDGEDHLAGDPRLARGALPERRTETDLTLVHGSPRDPIWEYVTTAPVARLNLEALTTPYGLHGHTHLPSVFRDEDGFVEMLSPSARVRPGARRPTSPGEPGQRRPAARRRPDGRAPIVHGRRAPGP